ncbi:MAG: TonB family protein [Steroidobacteraceae bacterium]
MLPGGSDGRGVRGVAAIASVVLHVGALAALVAATLFVPSEHVPPTAVTLVELMRAPAAGPPPLPIPRMEIPPPEVRAPVLDVAAPAPTAISAVLPAESSPAVGPPVAPAETAPMAIDASALTCTRRTPPEYPPQSRRLREEGAVQVQMELDADGRVISAVVIHGSGHSRLDAAAIEAVRQWHCQPARRSGTAVSAVAIQTFEFRLQRR